MKTEAQGIFGSAPRAFCYVYGAFVKKEYGFCEKYDISVKNTKKYLQNSKIYVIMEW